MHELHVLRVFTDERGGHGNPLGVFATPRTVPEGERQRVAADLGFSETVFVDDLAEGVVRIFTPTVELPLAGHPLVGTGWLLDFDLLRPPAGDVPTWCDGDVRWIRARPEWTPRLDLVAMENAEAVDALAGPPAGHDHVVCWAWADEESGHLRVRMFAPRYGIAEDEATGAAALRFAELFGRPITIVQGRGSILYARPGPGGTAEVGGRVVIDEVRDYARVSQ